MPRKPKVQQPERVPGVSRAARRPEDAPPRPAELVRVEPSDRVVVP